MSPRGRHTGVRARTVAIYLSLGALGTFLYVAVPPFKGNAPLLNLLGLSGVIAVAVGIVRNKPDSKLPWWCFVAGLALFWLGDVYTYSYRELFHKEVPFPSIGDAFYLAVYPVLMTGLMLLVRRRNSARSRDGSGIDAIIMTLGLALPSWVLLISPALHDPTQSLGQKLVSIAYPLGDILLLAATVRLALDKGRRRPTFYLLCASIVSLLITDFIYGVMLDAGTYHHQLSLDVGWTAFYLLWGAAALHPSMLKLDQPTPEGQAMLTKPRLALLAGASLIAPAILILQRHNNDTALVTICASVVLFGFVVARMAGLVRQQERSVARERVLSQAGADLVAARSVDETIAAALASMGALLDGQGTAVLCRHDPDGLFVTAREDRAAVDRNAHLSGETTSALLELAAVPEGDPGRRLAPAVRAELGLARHYTEAIVLGLRIRGEVRGLLVVARPVPTSRPLGGAFRSLATQLALALESADLNEEVHRRQSESRFAALVAHSSDLITVLNANATIEYQSPSSERVLGYGADELVGTRFDALLAPTEEGRILRLLADGSAYPSHEGETMECTLVHKDGSLRQFEILYSNLLDDEDVHGIVLNARDVSERKAFEEQLSHQAFHDPVTNLPNRALFVERVRHALARGRREGAGLAVIFLDLDDFKTVNDSLGHAAGDEVLVAAAKRLEESIRASDTAARFGGDEFAVLLEDIENVQEAADTAERIIEALGRPVAVGGKEIGIRCSLGISILDSARQPDADELIRDADAAMYIAKREGKGDYRMFEPAMHEGVMARLELRGDLQRALAAGELELYYQPVVRLEDGSVSGVEALLRWRHPRRGLVGPEEFIPFAEESGLIVPIGRWVLREACRQAMVMQREIGSDPPLSMGVNLSVKQLQHSDVVADVREALDDSGLAPELLMLEITETVMMTDSDLAIERLDDLRKLGVRLAMDDFGTGYSSLSYLSRFPVDVLKMDRSFLTEGASPEASDLASAVVAIGATLSLDVVAEGIELDEQWETLRALGCSRGQGFFFAEPMPIEETLDALRNWTERLAKAVNGGVRPEAPAADAT
jgi:diguanylate cyclase (GGDEF)-like protein/PAS domain S-box-containing protein